MFPEKGRLLEKGKLILQDGGYAVTEKLPFEISSKSLAARVRLDNLEQRGGGVISIQSPNGAVFDSIVFAEKEPRKWIAGSNGFRRTQSFGGAPFEKEADRNFVHLTVTYGGDGTITAYRNGEPYGKSYSTGSHLYKRDDCIVSFGVRHLPANPQRLLVGRIDEASLYDFELTAEDIRLISNPDTFVSQKQLYESLPSNLQRTYSKLTEKKSALEKEIRRMRENMAVSDKPELQDLALALFNMKEFIYLK